MKVKICGITTLEDARMSAQAGADMLGFNFYAKSPRYIQPETATQICDTLRLELGSNCPLFVGVFVNSSVNDIETITNQVGLDFAQLSGDETDAMLLELRGMGFKAIRPANQAQALEDVAYFSKHPPQKETAPTILLDAYHPALYGGTGEQASIDVALAVKASVHRMMLAGGLTPENIGERVASIQPWGVDVASGVESGVAGVKDTVKVRQFIKAAKAHG